MQPHVDRAHLPCAHWSVIVILSFALGLLLPGAHGQSSSLLQIQALQFAPPSAVSLTFSDQGSGATNYLLEYSPVLGPGASWTNISEAIIAPLGGGTFRVNFADRQSAEGYFRILGEGGSGAVSAQFSATQIQAAEGGMVFPTITFNAPFTGVIRYTLSGTAMSGDFQSLPGEVQVDGTSVTIPVSLTDNETIGRLKYLTLTLEPNPDVALAGGRSTTIFIAENDAEWLGVFNSRNTSVEFVLTIKELNGTSTATVKSDQLGLFPTEESGMTITRLSDQFAADAADIALEGDNSPGPWPTRLTLHLEAMNGMEDQSVGPTLIRGRGMLIFAVPSQPHLTTTNHGTFLLNKPPVAPSTNQVDLVDTF